MKPFDAYAVFSYCSLSMIKFPYAATSLLVEDFTEALARKLSLTRLRPMQDQKAALNHHASSPQVPPSASLASVSRRAIGLAGRSVRPSGDRATTPPLFLVEVFAERFTSTLVRRSIAESK
jgi:hypothetical protein